ncbi:MAG: methyltransferase [Polyangiaceae bacterium]
MSDHPTPAKILETGLAFWASKTLLSAVEIGLFTELAHGPQSFESLRGRLGLHVRSARDFFDTLTALGFLTRTDDTYANTRETDLFLDKKKPSYVGGILEMANHRLYPFWGHLTEALRTGQPQNELKGGGAGMFETLYADPARLREFLQSMTGLSHGANMTIAKKLPWSDYRTFVDVGTAQGDLAAQIALANPHLKGIGFDLPEVAPIFEDYTAATKTADRVSFQPGNFMNDPIPSADVVLMGHILHDWDLQTKKMLIQKAYDALPAGGAPRRLRSDHRRRAQQERVRLDDEPEHARRDARASTTLARTAARGCASGLPRRVSKRSSVPTRWSSRSSSRLDVAATRRSPRNARRTPRSRHGRAPCIARRLVDHTVVDVLPHGLREDARELAPLGRDHARKDAEAAARRDDVGGDLEVVHAREQGGLSAMIVHPAEALDVVHGGGVENERVGGELGLGLGKPARVRVALGRVDRPRDASPSLRATSRARWAGTRGAPDRPRPSRGRRCGRRR